MNVLEWKGVKGLKNLMWVVESLRGEKKRGSWGDD